MPFCLASQASLANPSCWWAGVGGTNSQVPIPVPSPLPPTSLITAQSKTASSSGSRMPAVERTPSCSPLSPCTCCRLLSAPWALGRWETIMMWHVHSPVSTCLPFPQLHSAHLLVAMRCNAMVRICACFVQRPLLCMARACVRAAVGATNGHGWYAPSSLPHAAGISLCPLSLY